MPRGAAISVENNFTRGLVTEFTAMNFPENAVTDTDNCVYSEEGAVSRRLGVDFESDFFVHDMTTLSSNPETFTEFKWVSVGNLGTTTFIVQQVGDKLIFFSEEDPSISANKKSFTIDLQTYKTPGATSQNVYENPCQYTTGRGFLFVAHPFCNPIYVEYDVDADSISTNEIIIQVRDLTGIDDTLDVDERPSTLSNLHKYNLYNQGWDAQTTTTVPGGDPGPYQQALQYWDDLRADFPSNADVFWLWKANGRYIPTAADIYTGNTPAPKGHYIFDAFNVDRSSVSGIPGIPGDTSGVARPSAICFYAGRVWYAGTRATRYSTRLYFSQLVEDDQTFGACYQRNDPTAEHIFDILDTDGGVIELPLIERVLSMTVLGDKLVIIGTNGVYTVSGNEAGAFKATNYTVKYVSEIGGVSHLSVVLAEGALLWWNYDGIYALTPDQGGFNFEVVSASKQTIQEFLDDIPYANKDFVKGVYNKRAHIVRWVYSDQEDLTGYQYNRILDFNTLSRAFYPHSVSTSGPIISGLINVSGRRVVSVLEDVLNDALEVVTTTGLDDVQVSIDDFIPLSETFKFTTIGLIDGGASGLTYSEMNDPDNLDWTSFGAGVSYSSYGVSGYRVRGDFLRATNSTPIVFVVRNFDDGSLQVKGIWDYGFRETSTHQLYLTRPEVEFISRRVKLRGKGRALQIRFDSVGQAPFELSGWASFDTGGTQP